MLRDWLRHLPATTTLLWCVGCQPAVRPSEVAGTYHLTGVSSEDIVQILSDSTYIHRVQLPNGGAVADTGQWKLVVDEGKLRIELDDFLMQPHQNLATPPRAKGVWATDVSRGRQRAVRLIVDDDAGMYYEKPGT